MKSRMLGSNAAKARATRPTERLPLTSMVDMMTILIVFLLQSFSDDGSLLTPAAGLALPTATSGDRPWNTVSIEVTESDLRVDGDLVCTMEDVEKSEEPTIPALAAALRGESAAIDAVDDVLPSGGVPKAGATTPNASAPAGETFAEAGRRVLIQCDRDREFAVLKKVLRTCSEAGYESPGLLVERSGS
ncbi:MAG: biopolymer transporter ExbD [Candidatus Eisenbacteria bacterium]